MRANRNRILRRIRTHEIPVSYTHLDVYKRQAQDSIPYQRMWPDGICRVTNTRYTKTIQYQDINYQLSQNEDKRCV